MSKLGFFDSGVGGLTVVRAAERVLGEFSYHYFGDTIHCPYGDRPLAEVRQFALNAVRFLAEQGCDRVVMACNISSSVALEPARERHPGLPIHGLINEELVEYIARVTVNKRVGVMATRGTVKSGRYRDALRARGMRVVQQACSPLVPMIEAGNLDGALVEQTLHPLVQPLRDAGVDTVVLGCTHYPLLRPVLRSLFDRGVTLVDPGRRMARRLRHLHTRANGRGPTARFTVSGDPGSVRSTLDDILDRDDAEVRQVSYDEVIAP